jgi:hypothetical protein
MIKQGSPNYNIHLLIPKENTDSWKNAIDGNFYQTGKQLLFVPSLLSRKEPTPIELLSVLNCKVQQI